MKCLATLEAEDHVSHLVWNGSGDRWIICPSSGSVLVADELGAVRESLSQHGMGNGAPSWFGGQAATCGFDGGIRLGGKPIHKGRGMIERVRTNADDSLLAATQGRNLLVFDRSGAVVESCIALPSPVADLRWNPAAPRELATSGAGGALLWRIGEAEPFARFDWGGASLEAVWSPDGRWLATADQTPSVHIFDIPADNPLHMEGFDGKVRAMAVSSDSKRLATAGSAVFTVWPLTGARGPEGARPIQVEGSASEVVAMDFSPWDGRLATGDTEGTLLVVTFEKGQFRRKRARLGAGISALAWHPATPRLAIGHTDGKVQLLDMA